MNTWNKEEVFLLSVMPRLIAITAYNAVSATHSFTAGILASLTNEDGEDVVVTNGSWRCSAVLEMGWERLDFGGRNWRYAKVIAPSGGGKWGR